MSTTITGPGQVGDTVKISWEGKVTESDGPYWVVRMPDGFVFSEEKLSNPGVTVEVVDRPWRAPDPGDSFMHADYVAFVYTIGPDGWGKRLSTVGAGVRPVFEPSRVEELDQAGLLKWIIRNGEVLV